MPAGRPLTHLGGGTTAVRSFRGGDGRPLPGGLLRNEGFLLSFFGTPLMRKGGRPRGGGRVSESKRATGLVMAALRGQNLFRFVSFRCGPPFPTPAFFHTGPGGPRGNGRCFSKNWLFSREGTPTAGNIFVLLAPIRRHRRGPVRPPEGGRARDSRGGASNWLGPSLGTGGEIRSIKSGPAAGTRGTGPKKSRFLKAPWGQAGGRGLQLLFFAHPGGARIGRFGRLRGGAGRGAVGREKKKPSGLPAIGRDLGGGPAIHQGDRPASPGVAPGNPALLKSPPQGGARARTRPILADQFQRARVPRGGGIYRGKAGTGI